MSNKSDSSIQIEEQKILFSKVREILNCSLEYNPKVNIDYDIHIEPDFYSFENRIIGEIYVHQGNLLPAHKDKISGDFLKMILLEKKMNCEYKKIFVTNNEKIKKFLDGHSWLAESSRAFSIDVWFMESSPDRKNEILNAQRLQREGMKE